MGAQGPRVGVIEEPERRQTPTVEEMVAVAAEAFRAAAQDQNLNERLARGDTSCALHVGDYGLTALLDRDPIEVADEPLADAESHIHGSEEAWQPVFTEGNLGIALARGELTWNGPVRKFLRVFPIFRTVYAEVALGHREVRR